MDFSMVLLPADLATISSESRMGTPEESIVPSVRVKRATATLRMSGPNMGSLSTVSCQISCPFPLEIQPLKAMKATVGMPMMRYQWERKASERSMRAWVGPGSAPPMSLNIFSKVGTTKPMRTPTTPTDTASTMTG